GRVGAIAWPHEDLRTAAAVLAGYDVAVRKECNAVAVVLDRRGRVLAALRARDLRDSAATLQPEDLEVPVRVERRHAAVLRGPLLREHLPVRIERDDAAAVGNLRALGHERSADGRVL